MAAPDMEEWSSGLFDCSKDRESCCLGLFCPCVLFGKNVERLKGRQMFGPCALHCLCGGGVAFALSYCLGPVAFWFTPVSCYACSYRTEIRAKYRLPSRPMGDCPTHFLCHPCAICQEYRQLKETPTKTGLDFYGGENGQSNGEVAMSAPEVSEMQAVPL